MAKIRYVKFNPDEWLVGTFGLNCGECGTYIQAISLMYSSGGGILPTDERLMRSLNSKPNIIRKHLLSLVNKNKLEFDGKYLVNTRVLNELQRVSKRIVNGTQAESKRIVNGTQTDSKRTVKDSENELNQSLTNSHTRNNNTTNNTKTNNTKKSVKKKKTLRQDLDKDIENNFGTIWKLWRKKTGKSVALLAYRKCLQKSSHDVILNGVNQYNFQNAETEQKYILMLSTFLNQERYNDYDSPVSDRPIKKMCEWENRISWFSRKGYWSSNWGSKPTTDKCEAPKDILEKYGYTKSNPGTEESK
tara:strand:+ start:31 stop:939 length:909 start_codon:yes stop_codon:yes gene_type:complete